MLTRPSYGGITQHYSSAHLGVDFGWGNGYEIFAVRDGVAKIEEDDFYGISVRVDHGRGYTSWSRHCARALVKDGERVTEGQIIAIKGNSGIFATFVHLHFEWRFLGVKINPEKLFRTKAGRPKPADVDAEEPSTPKPEIKVMAATIPVKTTENGVTVYVRRNGLLIERTTESAQMVRWCREVGYEGDPISANATKYLEDWPAQIAAEKAVLQSVLGKATVDAKVLAAELAPRLPKTDLTGVFLEISAIPQRVVDAIRSVWAIK